MEVLQALEVLGGVKDFSQRFDVFLSLPKHRVQKRGQLASALVVGNKKQHAFRKE
jgi:hypothetical protein